jgi:hypothetical protein
MSVKTQSFASGIEKRAYEQRLEQLGLKVKSDGTIDETSVSKLKHGDKQGLDALKAVLGTDGVLSAEAAAKLDVQLKFFDKLSGKKSPSLSERDTQAVRSLALSMEGLTNTLFKQADQLGRNEPLKKDEIDRMARETKNLADEWSKLVKPDSSLTGIDPEALKTFVGGFEQLTRGAWEYGVQLSKRREAILDTGYWTAHDASDVLKAMSAAMTQIDLIRDASVMIARRVPSEDQPPKTIDDLTAELATRLTPHQAAVKESAEAKAQRVKELLAKVGKLDDSPTIDVLAKAVQKLFNDPPGAKTDEAQALLLWSYEVPKTFASPNGPQRIVITPHGLRAVGVDDHKSTRAPDPGQLASAGVSWAEIEKALAKLLDDVTNHPDRLSPVTVELNREDRLYTNGRFPSVDFKAVQAEWKEALAQTTDAEARAQNLTRIINETAGALTAGEFRDFLRDTLDSLAKMDLGHGRAAQEKNAAALLPMMQTLQQHTARFPFYKSDLDGLDDRAEDVSKHVWDGMYVEGLYKEWLHAVDFEKFGKY